MHILMLETVVRPTAKGMFVGNHDDVVETDDLTAATLISEGKAAEVNYDADDRPATPAAPAAPAPAVIAPKNKGGRPKKAPASAAPAPVAPVAAPVEGEEAPAA